MALYLQSAPWYMFSVDGGAGGVFMSFINWESISQAIDHVKNSLCNYKYKDFVWRTTTLQYDNLIFKPGDLVVVKGNPIWFTMSLDNKVCEIWDIDDAGCYEVKEAVENEDEMPNLPTWHVCPSDVRALDER